MSGKTTEQITIGNFHVGDVVEFDHHGRHHKGIISQVDRVWSEFGMICDQCWSCRRAVWRLPETDGLPLEGLTTVKNEEGK